jgi:hypothetical protein
MEAPGNHLSIKLPNDLAVARSTTALSHKNSAKRYQATSAPVAAAQEQSKQLGLASVSLIILPPQAGKQVKATSKRSSGDS